MPTHSGASRSATFPNQVLFVDGLSGSGKLAIAPVLQGLARVEAPAARYIIDHLCFVHAVGDLTDQGATTLLRLVTDQTIYDNLISREVNFRPSDVTCVLNGPLAAEYQRRLTLPDGKPALDRIVTDRPILHLLGHQVFAAAGCMFKALGDRLTYVEVVRHPLNILQQWSSYIERYGRDPGDFTVWIRHAGSDLPWFAMGNEERYERLSGIDKVIFSLRWVKELKARALAALNGAERKRYHVFPFERFVRDPEPYIRLMEEVLDAPRTEALPGILAAQKIPRAVSGAGPVGMWTEKYGVQVSDERGSEADALRQHWERAQRSASPEALRELTLLCREYEDEFPTDAA